MLPLFDETFIELVTGAIDYCDAFYVEHVFLTWQNPPRSVFEGGACCCSEFLHVLTIIVIYPLAWNLLLISWTKLMIILLSLINRSTKKYDGKMMYSLISRERCMLMFAKLVIG